MYDSYWLDLFAGTGQVGIEALSRGATACIFVDLKMPAIHTIKDNLQRTKLIGKRNHPQTRCANLSYVTTKQPPLIIIFIAPPQYQAMWQPPLQIIDQQPTQFLTETGQIIVQIDPKEYEEQRFTHLHLTDQRSYGNTMLCFYAQKMFPNIVHEEIV